MSVGVGNTERDVVEFFWPEHLSGQEVKTKWPRGTDAEICRVEVEPVFDKQQNGSKEMVVVYFDGIDRGLVCNKTNGRLLAEMFGGDAEKWIGKSVSIVAAKRSNGTLGVDIDKPTVANP